MPWGVAAAAIGAYGATEAASAQEAAAETIAGAASQSADVNRARWVQAQGLMTPYVQAEESALEQYLVELGLAEGEAGTAYMQTPGYQGAITAGTEAVSQGAAGAGALYSGTRGQALADVGQGVQQSYYSNYMGMLGNMAQGGSASNLAALGVGQGLSSGSQQIQAAQGQAPYTTGAAATEAAGMADIITGLSEVDWGSFGGGTSTPPPQAIGGGIGTGTQYSGYV